MVQEGVVVPHVLRRELGSRGGHAHGGGPPFLGVGFSCYGRRAPARGCVGLLAGSAAPYSFSERAHQLPALLWENECARLAGGALDTTDSLLLCAYVLCVYT